MKVLGPSHLFCWKFAEIVFEFDDIMHKFEDCFDNKFGAVRGNPIRVSIF